MTEWTKQKRFSALLHGKIADRPIVSGWHHFLEQEQTAEDLATATISFAEKYDWDWIKINPRATYLAEAFGNRYDFTDYEWVFPRQVHAVVQQPEDLRLIKKVAVAESLPLQEQLAAVKQIRAALPETPIVQTIFSPLTILLFLTGNSSYVDQTMYGSDTPVAIKELLNTDSSSVHQALHEIALTMAAYVKELEAAGVDGLFYAVTGTAHPDLFDAATFNEYSKPYDLIVLHAMENGQRILHTCGSYAQPKRFDDYPVEGISWDTKAEGNPDLTLALNKTKVAGIDHHIFTGNQEATITKQAKEALQQTIDEPFLLVPNCAVSFNASDESLNTLRQSIYL
ncbi:uroporphyrinogen decarboxylase family protein [Paraliobacillus ryukyuensis]|uniref:uroporphyrinogen decarboxylase family protein n=1 Tax=Paraliobacillus ryukyuensis TaxID=200904 RepID=UPI0009A5E732|nr:uroporphyrinogen decarboxylase family protein [Paraliobacillus ryukyuensis]